MDPLLEKIPLYSSTSIAVKREIAAFMDYPWHYHPEYEIIFVEKSYGIRLMGNHIGNFSDGDLMFISSYLPHVWRNDNDFYQGNTKLYVDVYVIQFLEDALTKGFFDLPEFTGVRNLFLRGKQGLIVRKNSNDHRIISGLVKKVFNSSGIDRLVFFMQTLDAFSNATKYNLISSPGYTDSINNTDAERITKVINLLMKNYQQEIKLEEVANLVNLNKSSFCRYFKSRTNKTFSRVLNEIRITKACKLMVNSEMSVTEICYETGYNNISHFNRQFKYITGLTAGEYKNRFYKTAEYH